MAFGQGVTLRGLNTYLVGELDLLQGVLDQFDGTDSAPQTRLLAGEKCDLSHIFDKSKVGTLGRVSDASSLQVNYVQNEPRFLNRSDFLIQNTHESIFDGYFHAQESQRLIQMELIDRVLSPIRWDEPIINPNASHRRAKMCC